LALSGLRLAAGWHHHPISRSRVNPNAWSSRRTHASGCVPCSQALLKSNNLQFLHPPGGKTRDARRRTTPPPVLPGGLIHPYPVVKDARQPRLTASIDRLTPLRPSSVPRRGSRVGVRQL